MVTVLMATHNGAETLPQTLDSLCMLDAGALQWRLVAVDNASTDATSRILRAYEARLPLTILHEPRRGKNYAMNRGLDAVTSDLVLCIDDDVVLDRSWLLAITSTFDAHPDIDIVCGRVLPLWPGRVRPALLGAIPGDAAYAITPAGLEEGPCSPSLVFGCNMAFRMSICRSGHRFNPAVGPDGTRFYAMGAETEFVVRVHQAGHKIWFCGAARAQHIITPIQLTRSWLWTRAIALGRSHAQKARRGSPKADDVRRLFGVPRYMLPVIARHALAMGLATLRGDARSQCRELWESGYACGLAYESWRESRGIKP